MDTIKPPSTSRIQSIDLLRGLVMVLMALDHVRDYFHNGAMVADPLDLQTTTPALYFTRWITHFCAPVFVCLSGISAYLSGKRKTQKQLASFLLKRGLWLIVIEFTLVTFGWTFNPFFNNWVMQVIWAIGISMVALGLLVLLPYSWILTIALAIIFGHNLLDYYESAQQHQVGFWIDLLHHGSFTRYPVFGDHGVVIVYPFLPWIGIMALGYCLGPLFEPQYAEVRKTRLRLFGGLLLAVFVTVRVLNMYGDPHPWEAQPNAFYTFLSFLDVTKYPPSLAFTGITIGLALLFLSYTEKVSSRFSAPFIVFGQVPFFYYIVHIYLIHVLAAAAAFIILPTDVVLNADTFFQFRPRIFGFDLPFVYVVWIGILALLYKPCLWFQTYKATHKKWWLSYL